MERTRLPLLAAVRRVRDAIDRDFAQPLSLVTLADTAQCSKFHFARAFTQAYGETPRAYLTRRRIERAKDLLRGANLTVTEISLLVGFESQRHRKCAIRKKRSARSTSRVTPDRQSG